MTEPISRGMPPAGLSKCAEDAAFIGDLIGAARLTNELLLPDTPAEVAQPILEAVTGLLEAAEVSAKRLTRELEMNTGDARQ